MQILEQDPEHDFLKSRRRKQSASVDLSKLDRLPPHSLEAEQGVLGCMLLAPNESIRVCIDKFKKGAETFYDLRHQMLYEKLVKMHEAKLPIDLITISQDLRDTKQLEAMGGVAYLSSLMDAVPSAANLPYYADIVREKHKLRRVISTFTQTVANVYEFEGQVDKFLAETEAVVRDVVREDQLSERKEMKQLVHAVINKMEQYHERQGQIIGVPFGLTDIDRMVCGLEPADFVVIAARPSCGKTSLAMNVAANLSLNLKQASGVFSLEMTAEALVMRLACEQSNVPLYKVRKGLCSQADFSAITVAAGRLIESPFHIDDSAGINIRQLRARASDMKERNDIKVLIVDYLQLVKATDTNTEKRHQFAEVSEGLKALAKDLEIPVIALAQLNRDVEKRASEKPKISDIRECGNIEQDADVILLLSKSDEASSVVNCNIAKQRNGPTCDVALQFNKETFQFRNLSPIDDKDIPE